MASRASSARSSPWSSITGSTPSEDANSTNPNRSTFPPPDHGLHNKTGCEGGVTRRTRAAAVPRRLAASAPRADRTAAARSAREMAARTKDCQSSLPAPSNAETRRAAPVTIATIPYPRRGARFVIAHHPPATAKEKPAAPTTRYAPLRTRKPISATASRKPATSESTARARCRAVDTRFESDTCRHRYPVRPHGIGSARARDTRKTESLTPLG